jgi:2-oxoglutarate ferredoxin oxidoreductase subunit alpha
MKFNIIIGGKAGQGPNFITEILAKALIKEGFFVFYTRDYGSLIRGGHNFNQLTFSENPVFSNLSQIDVLVCLDEKTREIHEKNLAKKAIVIKFAEGKGNMFYAGMLFKLLGINFKALAEQLEEIERFEENLKDAKEGFKKENRKIKLKKPAKKNNLSLMNGSQAMAKSAVKSGLDFYYAYPMTPATPVMMELGQMQLDEDNKHKVIEMENEIAVALAGIGSSCVGKLAMAGTSGGGFDLMTESLSFAGMAEIPMVFYLSQRPGPGTGVATYTSQGDLNMALHSGHGEFSRLVFAPGDNEEIVRLTNNAFYLSQKFRIPAIIMMDKHLAESKSMFNEKKILNSLREIKSSVKKSERFNSYEHDLKKDNLATEDAKIIQANFERRMQKQLEINKETNKFEMWKGYGNENSGTLLLGWGSTKGAVLDVLENCNTQVNAKFIQILFMEPFPTEDIKREIAKANKVIVIENNSTSPLSRLIAEKTGFFCDDKNKILRYDGRPFFSDELAEEINKRLKEKK